MSHDPSEIILICWFGALYIYAFSRRFYPKRLTVHSVYTIILFGQYVFFQNKLSESKLLKGNVSIYKMATVSVFLIVQSLQWIIHLTFSQMWILC